MMENVVKNECFIVSAQFNRTLFCCRFIINFLPIHFFVVVVLFFFYV